MSTNAPRGAYLPFSLTQGLIYTLQVDLNRGDTGNNWLGAGFSVNAGSGGGNPHTEGSTTPYGWMLLRGNGDAQSFTGGNTTGGSNMNTWVGNTATIVLNTTNVADYTVEFFDGNGTRRGPVSIGTPTLDHVFIANGNQDGSFDNFTLSDNIPEPATMSLLALGGLTLLRRRRRA